MSLDLSIYIETNQQNYMAKQAFLMNGDLFIQTDWGNKR